MAINVNNTRNTTAPSSGVGTEALDALVLQLTQRDDTFTPIIDDPMNMGEGSSFEGPSAEPETLAPFVQAQRVIVTDPVDGTEREAVYGGEAANGQAILEPVEGGQSIAIDHANIRAKDLNASAMQAINAKYGKYTQALKNRRQEMVDNGASTIDLYSIDEQLNEFNAALQLDQQSQEELVAPVVAEDSQATTTEAIGQEIEQGRNPVEIFVEHAFGIDPADTERTKTAMIQVAQNPGLKQSFVDWATKNKSLSKVVEYSKAQKALEGTTQEYLKDANPIAQLRDLSEGLAELTPEEIQRIPDIIAGTQEYAFSGMDEFTKEWDNGTVIIFDTETTGTEDNALILQIGATKRYPDGTTEHFNVFVNQKQAILPDGSVKASHIHNISKSMILKGESPTAAFEAFNAFISDATSYVAHNVDFDIGKIKHNFKEASVSVDISSKLEFDSVVLAQESFYKFTANRKSLKLTDLSRDLKVNVDTTGLSADAANAHRADYDSRMLQGVLQKLYESHKQSGAFTTTLDPSREQILQKVSKSLLALYPDTNPMLAIKDLLYAQEASSGSLGITNKPIISTSNKASTLFNFDSASTAVDNVLMSMMANVANKDGIEQVLASISSTANTNANVTNTLFALAQQFSGSKGLANMDRVVADAMTLAVFSEALEVYGHEITLDKQHGDAALLYRDEEQDMVNEARRNLIVGEKVQQLLSIPVSDPEISAALGAIATTAVASALQVNEQGEGSFGVNSNLTPSGRVFGYQLAPLSQALLGTKADKDHYRSNKISEKDWNSRNRYIKATRIKGSAPADVFAHVYDKLGHDDQWQRDALLELSNMGFRWDTDLFMNMDQLIDNEGFNGLLKIRGYTDAEGNEAKGSFNNGRNAYIDATDNDGRVIPKIKALELIHQSLKAGHQAGTLNPKETKEYWETQKHVYDPNSTDPIYNRANVQEAYHGDKLKDMNLQRLMSMIVPKDENGQWKTKTDQNGKASQVKFGGTFYTDWFMGLNGRFYMKQYIGNFQSSKAARGGIMADEDAVYNSQEDIMELKAGVMKKFGGEYSKMGVKEAASHFAEHAKEWHGLMYPSGASSQDWSANADAILKIANNEEKFLSLSAMREGARLWQEYGVDVDGKRDNTTNMADIANISSRTNRKAIKSKFFTEVDGVANGTAHNAMQAGSFEAAAATNLNPLIALNSELFEHKKGREGEDIYAISGMALMESIKQSGKLVLVDLFDKLGMDSAKRRDFMKKPVMIFAYGAGQITIKKSVREGLEELFDQDGVRDKLTTALNVHLDTGTLVLPEKQSGLEWLIDQIGTQVNSAVATKFEAITQITGLLSQLASAAVEQGITPSLRMPNGNVIIFGMQYQKARSVTKSKEDLVNAKRDVANAQRKYDKAVQDGAPNKVQSEARATLQTAIAKAKLVESRLDFNDAPLYVVDTTFHTDARVANRPNGNQYQIDPVYYKAHMTDADMKDAILKAATQAAVLITHNLDATNMLQGIMNARKPGKLGSAAQVFDGIFMTPKDARTYSKHLNKEFFRIHNEFHYIDQFKRDLESLVEGDNSQFDKRGMQGIRAMLHKIEKAVAAHKKLLRHFEFGDRFIHQFFWDGATAVDKQFVVDSIAKAKKANKRLYSLDSSDDEGGRLRGKNANKLPDEFFDQFDTNNAYLADLDNRLTTTAK